jgi:hypothetical protein
VGASILSTIHTTYSPLNSWVTVGLECAVSPRPRQKDIGTEGLVQVEQTFSKRLVVNGLVND